MVLTIHHLGHSQSDRVVFLCEELSIPYTLEIHHRSPLLAPPSMKSLHPLGSSPIITDTDTDTDATSPTNPLILAETQACFEYIIHRHGSGRFYPRPDAPHYADFLFYYHVVNGTLQPTVLRLMTLSVSGVPVSSPLHASTRAKLDVVFGLLDTQVGRHTWLAGEEFTGEI
jgi:glutathione S-transferase